ncbi:MAG: PAS domain-containing protein [Chloroflexi bacterium]|nr:PAS domain-containing protein [Chloroflexota bacterium]
MEANLTVAVLLDLSRTELLKQPLPRFIRKEDADRYYLLSKQLIKTGTPQTCQLGMVRTDGVEFWACLDMNAAHGADGESFCLVAISDITAHKLAEDTLQQAHAVLELRVAERTDDLRKEIIERKQAEYQTKKRLKELQAFYSLAEHWIIYIRNWRTSCRKAGSTRRSLAPGS